MSKKEVENLIREFVLLELEQNPQRKATDVNQLADDSLDVAMDRNITNFDKNAKSDQGLAIEKFTADVARFAEHLEQQLDMKGVLVRRVANYVSKTYDEKVSKEVLRVLEEEFGLSTDPSHEASGVQDRDVPLGANAGPDANGPGGAPPT
jgi:hypothetical protein